MEIIHLTLCFAILWVQAIWFVLYLLELCEKFSYVFLYSESTIVAWENTVDFLITRLHPICANSWNSFRNTSNKSSSVLFRTWAMIEPVSESSRSFFDIMKYTTTFVSFVASSLAVFVLVRYLPYATSAYRSLLIGTTVSNIQKNKKKLRGIQGHLLISWFSPSNFDGSSVHVRTSMHVLRWNSRYYFSCPFVCRLCEIAENIFFVYLMKL